MQPQNQPLSQRIAQVRGPIGLLFQFFYPIPSKKAIMRCIEGYK